MIHLSDYLYEAELNLEWWNSKSPAYQKRYLTKHPNSIYAQKAKSGELEVKGQDSTTSDQSTEKEEKQKSLQKIDKKRASREEQIKHNQEYLAKVEPKYHELLAQYRAIPSTINRTWTDGHWEYATPQDEANDKKRQDLRSEIRVYGADIDRVKHNIEVAQRYLQKLHRQENFEARQATPNATSKYKDSGIAKVVDFSGMDEQTEKDAVEAVAENIRRYPFMKDHLTFLGSHKSSKFQQLSDQQAHDFYLDQIQKEYDKEKDYYTESMKGYTGTEKDPSRAYRDEANWIDEDARRHLYYHMFSTEQAYERMQRIEARGGPEGYLRTPSYQNAINRWKRMKSRNWAYYRPNTLTNGQEGLIAFNENKFDDADLQHYVDIKWHPEGCGTKKATMDHEFGHAIWYKLGLNKVGQPHVNGNDYAGRSPLQQYIAKELSSPKESIKNNLSEYGATNSSEFFAEAYSEYLNNPNPRPIAKKVGELLDQEIEARGYKK